MFKARRGILLVAVTAAFVGCSDSSTGPSSPSVPDVATLIAEISSPTLSIAAAIATPMLGPALSSSPVDPGKCPYSAASGFFECPAVTTNGLTYTRSFRLIDDAGSSQSKPDTHTSAFEIRTTVDGTLSTASLTIHGTDDETLSGLQTTTHTLNGASVMSFTGTTTIGTDVFPIDQTVSLTTSNLVLPNTKAGQRWPQSGTMTIALLTPPSGSSKMVITFNGTSIVTITSTALGSTFTCHVDLANPAAGLSACA